MIDQPVLGEQLYFGHRCCSHVAWPPASVPGESLYLVQQLEFWSHAAFYIWVTLMNVLATSTMWSRLADVFTSDAGARLFGLVGAGATMGQLVRPSPCHLPSRPWRPSRSAETGRSASSVAQCTLSCCIGNVSGALKGTQCLSSVFVFLSCARSISPPYALICGD